jgi:hypothetical protein
MSTWVWVVVGLAAFLLLSTVIVIAVARILGRIGHDVTELLDFAAWSSAPLAREHVEDEPASRETVPSRAQHVAPRPRQRS